MKLFDNPEKIKSNIPSSYQLNNNKISCPHCSNDKFLKGTALLNTSWMTFFSLDWANKQASILFCDQCMQIQWFLKNPERI